MRGLVLYAIAGGLVVALVAVYFLVTAPAGNQLTGLLTKIERPDDGSFAVVDATLEDFAGPAHATALQGLKSEFDDAADRQVKELQSRTASISRWFSDLGGIAVSGVPPRDEFKRLLKFQEDELPRNLEELVQKLDGGAGLLQSVRPAGPKMPAFLAEDRLPTEEEMRKWQRLFNIQRMLLVPAATAGAVPFKAPEITYDWKSDAAPGRHFREERVVLYMALHAHRLPAVLRSLVGLDGQGPIVSLEGLSTRPRPQPKKLEADQVPPIEAEIHLRISLFVQRS